jgi:hypothetical protein
MQHAVDILKLLPLTPVWSSSTYVLALHFAWGLSQNLCEDIQTQISSQSETYSLRLPKNVSLLSYKSTHLICDQVHIQKYINVFDA